MSSASMATRWMGTSWGRPGNRAVNVGAWIVMLRQHPWCVLARKAGYHRVARHTPARRRGLGRVVRIRGSQGHQAPTPSPDTFGHSNMGHREIAAQLGCGAHSPSNPFGYHYKHATFPKGASLALHSSCITPSVLAVVNALDWSP